MSHSTTWVAPWVDSVASVSAERQSLCVFGAPRLAPPRTSVSHSTYLDKRGSPMYSLIFQYRSRGALVCPDITTDTDHFTLTLSRAALLEIDGIADRTPPAYFFLFSPPENSILTRFDPEQRLKRRSLFPPCKNASLRPLPRRRPEPVRTQGRPPPPQAGRARRARESSSPCRTPPMRTAAAVICAPKSLASRQRMPGCVAASRPSPASKSKMRVTKIA